MASECSKNSIDNQLQSRLDDLFQEDYRFAADSVSTKQQPAPYPLAELKNLILSIDWEITDDALAELLTQIKALKKTFESDQIVVMFLQMLGSLGDYIKTYRAKAHPQTFKILNSIFSRLDEVVVSADMAQSDRKRVLRAELEKYNELRRKIARSLAVCGEEKRTQTVKATKAPIQKEPMLDAGGPMQAPESVICEPAPTSASEMRDALADAVKELKRFIGGELQALREELRSVANSKKA